MKNPCFALFFFLGLFVFSPCRMLAQQAITDADIPAPAPPAENDTWILDSLASLRQQITEIKTHPIFLDKVRINGWLQFQYERAGKDGVTDVGNSITESPGHPFSRVGVRRGRLRVEYMEKMYRFLYQIDFTENAIGVRDALVDVFIPGIRSCFLRGGIFFRPFGFEISYSSALRESPERATVIRQLFPNYRDIGATVVLQAPPKASWNFLRLEGGWFVGNGINAATTSRRDFIGRFVAMKNTDRMGWRLGASYYFGHVFQGTENVYTMRGGSFALDQSESNIGRYAGRIYYGFEGEFSYMTPIGRTIIRGEYLWGRQPGSVNSSESPRSSVLPSYDTYIRPFSGWYAYFIQYIKNTPLRIVLKYDRYDPNTAVSGNIVGVPGTNTTPTDLAVGTFGFGASWIFSRNFLLMAYYEIVRNETTVNIPAYDHIRSANLLTLRIQCRY